jgi:UDP-N-acetylmuramoyl-tripeptide--D-alanyl-D-alanine ligase
LKAGFLTEDSKALSALYAIYLGATGVATDTRKCGQNTLFFALVGENFDGNRFAQDALDGGCIAAVVDDPALFDAPGMFGVADVLTALQSLATHHRGHWDFPVIGLTGSNGKTTTKELLLAVLGKHFDVHGTRGNLNNHIGVPLTLLDIPASSQIAIIEMGANHRGEIQELCAIASPTHGLITNIGRAHLEGFGGEEGVLLGKAELYDSLRKSGGTAFVRSDDSALLAVSEGIARNLYGGEFSADCRHIDFALPGAHNMLNADAAIAVGRHFGLSTGAICSALQAFVPHSGRGELKTTSENVLLLDCYNANPSSVEAAVRSFAAERTTPHKLCIIGDMKELGDFASESHQQTLLLMDELGLAHWVVGPCFMEVAGPDTIAFPDTDAVIARLSAQPIKGQFILLKGSRSMALERLIDLL